MFSKLVIKDHFNVYTLNDYPEMSHNNAIKMRSIKLIGLERYRFSNNIDIDNIILIFLILNIFFINSVKIIM